MESRDPRPPCALCVPLGHAVQKCSVGDGRQRKTAEKLGWDKATLTNRHADGRVSRGKNVSQSNRALLHPSRAGFLPIGVGAEAA